MAVIKNLCGTEPPVACTCQPEDGEDSDEDDIGNLYLVQLIEQPILRIPERLDKEHSCVKEPFPVTKCQFTS